MFIFGNLVLAMAKVLDIVLDVYKWIIIISAIISWVNPDPYNPIVRFLYSVTEPALRPIRRVIGGRLGPIDISPLVVILAIIFIQKFLISSLMELGYKIKGGALI
ncbi:YggT family protein [Dissulfurispira thermophila]|uniref:YggT family protein n=2 Tax=root TaxID=1 RepID=A0A7G1H5J8_9BACT|nr:YggT family protein [Dissulfurispira thermophila]BCB97382.1 YggT family protein [Dissulfurispira thermophila]